MTVHTAPDGRTFRTYTARCFHLDPCWQARCQCGVKLTAHDFTEEDAAGCALQVLTQAGLLGSHGECRA